MWLVFAGSALAGGPLGDQVRVSQAGPDADTNFGAFEPAVAFNSAANQFLVVWSAEYATDGEFEIFGRLFDEQGNPVAGEFRISEMGPDGNTSFGAFDPVVAFNPVANEYLVAWDGDDDTAPLVEDEFEIFVQRLSASGTEIGVDTRISDMGPDGNTNFDTNKPAVAFNSMATNEYLVAWWGDDDTAPLVEGELEIFVQRLSSIGTEITEIGVDTRISDMGPDGNTNFSAREPAVAFNPVENEYLVDLVGRRRRRGHSARYSCSDCLRAAQRSGWTRGSRRWDDPTATPTAPRRRSRSTAWRTSTSSTWWGDDDTAPLVEGEFEIFVQRLSAIGTEIGVDTRISDMGPDGNTNFSAREPAVAFNPVENEYLVAWWGDDDTAPLVDGRVRDLRAATLRDRHRDRRGHEDLADGPRRQHQLQRAQAGGRVQPGHR